MDKGDVKDLDPDKAFKQPDIFVARHLPKFAWEPLILTAHPRAYERVSVDQLTDLPTKTIVERAFALDSSRHFALMGRYPAFTARPDRWVTWWLGAVVKGLAMIMQYSAWLCELAATL